MDRKTGPSKPKRSMHEHHSVTIRQISNGFIVSTSHDKGGDYQSVETYHAKKPKITLPEPGKTGTVKQMAGRMKKFLGGSL